MSKISLAAKIMACFMLLLLLAVASSVLSVISMRGAHTDLTEMSDVTMPLNISAARMTDQAWNMVLSARMFTVYGREADFTDAETAYKAAMAASAEVQDALKRSIEPGTNELAAEMQAAMDTTTLFYESLVKTHNNVAVLNRLLAEVDTAKIAAAVAMEDVAKIATSPAMISQEVIRGRITTFMPSLFEAVIASETAVSMLTTAASNRSATEANLANKYLDQVVEKMAFVRNAVAAPLVVAAIETAQAEINDAIIKIHELEALLVTMEENAANRVTYAAAVTDAVFNITNSSIGTATTRANNLNTTLSTTSTISMILTAALLAVGVFSIIFLNINVVRKLKDFVLIMADFTSGDGDLTKRVPVNTEDEIGQLGTHVNTFVASIQEIITQVKNASEDVASGNTQLAATMEELSTTFNLQSEQVSSVASNMGVMNDTSQGIVNTVNEGMSAMTDAGNAVENGNHELQSVMRTMESIKDQTTQLSGTIKQLAESSVQIGEILTVISGIADQTNLLALNAAIEAARAGEAGRGFAVVADEVRKLAEGTQTSTNEIAAIINTLQKDTSNASTEMSRAVDTVDQGMEGITQTGAQMSQIVDASSNVQNSLNSISGEVTNQFGMMNEMSDNTQGLASGIEESVHAVNEVSATVSHLQQQAEQLKSIVSQFRI
ncbi:MAG: methyl-accepting chemotaxis protein [Deferribacteraceae bacterium]|jgi:methyl-accepting chemotaxis protein|nr:methyl-accepting chemotaxis protein [Deferribacteraceae bacterium]